MATPAFDSSPRDAFRVLFRHKVKAVLFLLFTLVAAVVATILTPKAYRSEGRLLIRAGWENTRLDPVTTLGEAAVVTNFGQIREFEINSVVAILTSRAVIEKVVDAIGPAAILGEAEHALPAAEAGANRDVDSGRLSGTAAPAGTTESDMLVGGEAEREPRDEAIIVVLDNLAVEAIDKSNVILVSYEGPSPELSQAVVAELMEVYVGLHVQLNRARGAHEFLARQTNDLYDQLAEKEQELRDLKNETEIVSPSHKREELSAQMGIVDRALLEAAAEEAASEARKAALIGELGDLEPLEVTAKSTGPDRALVGMRGQLYNLQLKEKQLAADSKEDFFQVNQVREQLDRAKAILDEMPLLTETTEGRSRAYDDVYLALLQEEPVLAALHAKTRQLEEQRVELVDQLRSFNDQDLRIRRLEREIELRDTNYRQYVANLEQARIDQALEDERISSISIVQPASFEVDSVRPRTLLNLAVGLMLGVFGGVGVAFLSEYLGNAQRTAGDAEQKEER
jgi:uncharacterized protein involved in exopolysaccharide biosynthesis